VWHGIGGVGKSAFSTHVAERLMEADTFRVIVLRGEQTPAQVMEEAERRLRFWALDEKDTHTADELRRLAAGLTSQGGLDEQGRWDWLREKVLADVPIVFVFDNFEDNLANVPTRAQPKAPLELDRGRPYGLKSEELDRRLRELLAGRGRARFLFTSRYPFGLGPDRRLCGLCETHLGPLSEAEARKLMHHLPRLRVLTASEKTEAFRTVGGHPRCLEYLFTKYSN